MRNLWRLAIATVFWFGYIATDEVHVPHRAAATIIVVPAAPVELREGSRGPAVSALQRRLNELATNVCLTKRCVAKYRVAVDGRFGPDTREAVEMFQAQNLLIRDGVVGPKTREKLTAPRAPCDAAELALRAAGATPSEIHHGVAIAKRESGCHLAEWADRPQTGDYSWGPFQINYIGKLRAQRTERYGPPTAQTHTWEHAVDTFLKFARTSGYCGWSRYCR